MVSMDKGREATWISVAGARDLPTWKQVPSTVRVAVCHTSLQVSLSQAIRRARLEASRPRGGWGGHSGIAAVASRSAAAPWSGSSDSGGELGQRGRRTEPARGRSQRLPSSEVWVPSGSCFQREVPKFLVHKGRLRLPSLVLGPSLCEPRSSPTVSQGSRCRGDTAGSRVAAVPASGWFEPQRSHRWWRSV